MLSKLPELIEFYNSSEEFCLAVSHTAEQTGFSSDLIEKDYLCSILLMYLYSQSECCLIFKGGTLLAKTYADFYRLSEDLDFTVPISRTANRKQRSNAINPLKKLLSSIESNQSIFKVEFELKGSDDSRQYNMQLGYKSQVSPRPGKIFIEIGLREELLLPVTTIGARTLLIDPYSRSPKVKDISISSLSLDEAYAEKTRAALCRKKLAIRDFYDLDYALVNNLITLKNEIFVNLVKEKIKYETHFHDFKDPDIIKNLQSRIISELEPTLKKTSLMDFNLERIIETLLVCDLNY